MPLRAKRASSTRAHVARVREIDSLAAPRFASIRWARAAFGRPTTRQRTQDYCRVSWRTPGLTIILNRVGQSNPCAAGQPVGAVVKGTQWRTSKGLRIGQPLRLLRAKYPHAGARPDGWWLLVVKPTSVFGRTRPQPTLMAQVRHGRIRAFVIG
jgi:hypothetical protein